ncbi:hypothetical protein BraRD5C2_71020 [Bradyrhizobium sp. RD5-C2]|nr:hypothetical protein BraRD5C2_71020 [Bradyrhizobium sp. RD5-C2]
MIVARRWGTAFLTNPILWLWVPAFAGTTNGKSGAPIPDHRRDSGAGGGGAVAPAASERCTITVSDQRP